MDCLHRPPQSMLWSTLNPWNTRLFEFKALLFTMFIYLSKINIFMNEWLIWSYPSMFRNWDVNLAWRYFNKACLYVIIFLISNMIWYAISFWKLVDRLDSDMYFLLLNLCKIRSNLILKNGYFLVKNHEEQVLYTMKFM